ncbi:hypothetical protein SCATT_17200 [Streptantibioticus cattleyicolor NRRL 8057 = DSM 46488]|uniref:Uncharacterized protein n=1 Tax=Streptantibioticus cattleyicolor (strain ATCC 35852 / DSM 46488 / JCM 4925 / NBRC 14057 / NRRL 8057) TaxID=1003195 RepID=G8WP58_STREN|nr:hypothetical protein SCATT_17200 [Streptantibioticus cattleyicolor NRRL 8057 = DSM 46488]
MLGYYSTGRDYVTRALIACPRPKRHAYSEEPPRCPAPL